MCLAKEGFLEMECVWHYSGSTIWPILSALRESRAL